MPTEPTPELRGDRIACFAWRDGISCTEVRDYAADEIRAAVTAERDRMASILETEIHAITSRNSAARFIGLSPLGLLTEILADIRAEPERGK